MFFVKNLHQTLSVHPSFFDPRLPDFVRNLLHSKVEGTCSGRLGYIIAVINIDNIGKGKILQGGSATMSGGAEFKVAYSAIVYRPFRGEVVDGIVASVNKMGIFADVGPLSCFISTHLIPADFKFDPNANPPCFASEEDTFNIEKGTKIRLKIVGTRVDATEIFAIGTIKEDYLGPIS